MTLAAVGGPASAAQIAPPYDDHATETTELPDSTGNGTATASASADKTTGALSVAAATTEDLPVGIAVPGRPERVGMSQAGATARVLDSVEVNGPGTYQVTVTFSAITAQANATLPGGYSYVSNSVASAAISGRVTVEDCVGVICQEILAREDIRYVAQSGVPRTSRPTEAMTFTVTTANTQGVSVIRIVAALHANAFSQGAGTAAAQASTTVSSIDVVQL